MQPVSILDRLSAIAAGSSGPISISARDAREIGLDCPGSVRVIGADELRATIEALRNPPAAAPEVTATAEPEAKPDTKGKKKSKPDSKPEGDAAETDGEPKPE